MIEAKKHIETKREGEYELVKRHIIEIKDFDINFFNHIIDETYVLDDSEDSYHAGVPQSIDGDIAYLDVDKFISYLQDKIKDYKDEGDEDNEHFVKDMEKMVNYLEKYGGYDIWFD